MRIMQYKVSVCVTDGEAGKLTAQQIADFLQEYITQTPESEISACVVEAEQVRDAEITQKYEE